MRRDDRPDPGQVLRDGEALDRAMLAAQRRVIRTHRHLGIPLVFWRDGRVVEVDPNSVALPEDDPSVPAADRR